MSYDFGVVTEVWNTMLYSSPLFPFDPRSNGYGQNDSSIVGLYGSLGFINAVSLLDAEC